MGFSRLEYWSGLPLLSSRDLPDPGIEPECPALQVDSLPSEPAGKPQYQRDGPLKQDLNRTCHLLDSKDI